MFGKGFRKPKKLTNAQKEKQEQAKNFIEKYTELCKEHGLQWDIAYEFNPREGLTARFVLIEHREKPKDGFECQSWDKCKVDNEETRKKMAEEAEKKMEGDKR